MAAQCSEHSMTIDAFELAKKGELIEGDIPLYRMPRLAESLLSTDGSLHYSVQGRTDADGPGADLGLSARLLLACQRCNAPLDYALERHTRFRFFRNEAELDAIPLDDDEVDAIVGSRSMDLNEWIEDEAILSLPLVPRHEHCRPDRAADAGDAAETRRPFAVLAGLKRSATDDQA
jgi:uncharacterized protein